jgi:hypothetical protein
MDIATATIDVDVHLRILYSAASRVMCVLMCVNRRGTEYAGTDTEFSPVFCIFYYVSCILHIYFFHVSFFSSATSTSFPPLQKWRKKMEMPEAALYISLLLLKQLVH